MLHTLSHRQASALEQLEAKYPATLFKMVTWTGACAVFEHSDLESEGTFAITPTGLTLRVEYNALTGDVEHTGEAAARLSALAMAN
jgi:hypothetical protein